MIEKMKMETKNMAQTNIEKLEDLFPNVITEKIDEEKSTQEQKVFKKSINFDLLKQLLSNNIVENEEAYEFTWVGKKEAIVEANKQINKTLRPCINESKNWDETKNLYIEGDNIDVLKLLQESYLNSIKMIYIDPPYNTGNDSFAYPDKYIMDKEEYEAEVEYRNNMGDIQFKKNSESNPRYHSIWCSMIYSRLLLCRNLLSNDGVIFISIHDVEYANLKLICDEVFGARRYLGTIVWKARVKPVNIGEAKYRPQKEIEYILVYEKSSIGNKFYPLITGSIRAYPYVLNERKYRLTTILKSNRGTNYRSTMSFEINGYTPPDGQRWQAGEDEIRRLFNAGYIEFKEGTPFKRYFEDEEGEEHDPFYCFMENDWSSTSEAGKQELNDILGEFHGFDTVKPTTLLRTLIMSCTQKDDIVLDFFSGSATTAHAVMKLNAEEENHRRFILVQYPEPCTGSNKIDEIPVNNICELGKERIRRAGEKIKQGSPITATDLDVGFRVFKLDDSNMKDVYYAATNYNQSMLDLLASNIKEDRTDLDLLFGCLLEWGLPLSLPHRSERIENITIHIINDGDLIACFDENVSDLVIKEIAKKQPLRVVFRDSSFASSPAKINVEEIFNILAPNTKIKVI